MDSAESAEDSVLNVLDYDDVSDVKNKFHTPKVTQEDPDVDQDFIKQIEAQDKNPPYAKVAKDIINKVIEDFLKKNPYAEGGQRYKRKVEDPNGGKPAFLYVHSNMRTGEQTLNFNYIDSVKKSEISYEIKFDAEGNVTHVDKNVDGRDNAKVNENELKTVLDSIYSAM